MAKIVRAAKYVQGHFNRMALYQSLTSIGLHFIVAFLVTWAVTGQAVLSGLVALIEPVACHFAHEVHDSVWERKLRQARQSGRFHSPAAVALAA